MAQEKQEKQQPTQVSVRGKSPWVEKYRPKHLVDVIGATEHLQRFKAIVDSGNMLNLMFSGPPGIGKTTIALCMAQALLGPLGPNVFDEAVLELNASDDRGVDVIHNKIKTFAKKHLELKGRHKLILLDEADSMEPAAQHALCCIIEDFSSTTRFALTCNDSSKLIEALQSRFAIIRCLPLSQDKIVGRLKQIADAEKVEYTPEALQSLALYSQGDLRTAITNLQATANSKTIVNKENVVKVIDVPCPERVQTMLLLCSDRKFYLAVELMLKLLSEGYSVKDILSMAFTVCNHANFKDDIFKLNFLKEIGLTQCKASNGVSSSLQMCGLVARLCFLSPLPPKPQTPKPTTSASASSNVSVSKVDAKDGK